MSCDITPSSTRWPRMNTSPVNTLSSMTGSDVRVRRLGRLHELADRGHQAAIVTVGGLSDGQGEQGDRRELHEADQAEVERAAGQVVELPADRDAQDVERDVGQDPRTPEEGERGVGAQHCGIVAESPRAARR